MSARNKHSPSRTDSVSTDRVREAITALLLKASAFVAPGRVEETARGLLPRTAPAASRSELRIVGDTLGMAMDLALFAPSASGQTAFDRLAKQRRGLGAAEADALDALRRSTFRLLRIEAGGAGSASLRDLASGEMLHVADDAIGAGLAGVALVGRLGPFGRRCAFRRCQPSIPIETSRLFRSKPAGDSDDPSRVAVRVVSG